MRVMNVICYISRADNYYPISYCYCANSTPMIKSINLYFHAPRRRYKSSKVIFNSPGLRYIINDVLTKIVKNGYFEEAEKCPIG